MRGRLVAAVTALVTVAVLASAGATFGGTAAVPKITFGPAEDGWYTVKVTPAAQVRVRLYNGIDCRFTSDHCGSYKLLGESVVARGQAGHVSWLKPSAWGLPVTRKGDIFTQGRYRMTFDVPGSKASLITTQWNLQFGD